MIQLEGISKRYKNGKLVTTAVDNVSLTINKGDIFGIIGHSGAGKSTLIRCVNLLERPTEGRVIVGGTDLTALKSGMLQDARKRIGMIFQHFNLLTTATVRANVAFPLELAKMPRAQIRNRVDELLKLVGLSEHGDKYPAQLSGGQKQRVGIARALANNPHVLLCDEATSALDPQTTSSILSLLLDINRQLGITILLITHEMNVIRSICNRVAVMDKGRVVETGDVLDVFLKPQMQVTKDFVAQVADTIDSGHFDNRPEGIVVRVHFIGEVTYEPILYEEVKKTSATFAILQGTVSRMKDTPYGQLVVELRGSAADTGSVLEGLRKRGLDVEVIG
ncbi:methionine ABC transporter ATP-binding protein [Paenibacillus tarimensis]|uniref:methionine ABC transporter ATP-binding protein n=1 Tax=Paenibacillus tarimensis TaxID=416012 RepID=UPI001F26805A|nr:methionine ABC transporter ATP-binding protein [Paenibacillus tarimensis]MCF2946313.1 methionine ABC transporter ATP-binding protein [Paenibacillus tarimensis]